MNFSKLPTIAVFTALCLTDCSEETGVATDAIDGISGNEIPGGEFPGSSAMFPGGYRYISAKGNMVDVFDANGSGKMTGGVLLAFGNFSTDLPKCATVTYNNSSYYGSNNAAFKPTYQGNAIIYGGSVTSVAQVQTNGMTEVKFPNGVSYMYK